jgi:hypothetical protein
VATQETHLSSECEELRKTSGVHQSEQGDDALYVFLRVHHCICIRLEHDQSFLALRSLNGLFARRFLEVYANAMSGNFPPRGVSYRWIPAFNAYRESPHRYELVLHQMAKAHILDDLSECLYECFHETATENIPELKKVYDDVLDVIIGCLGEVLRNVSGNSAARRVLARLLNNRVGGIYIQHLRQRAWIRFERRRDLAQKWPKPSGDT